MNPFARILAASAIFTASAAAAQEPAGTVSTCFNMHHDGYLVMPLPGYTPLSADDFNNSLGEKLVASVVNPRTGYLKIQPVDPASDCRQFMARMRTSKHVETIEPDWIKSEYKMEP